MKTPDLFELAAQAGANPCEKIPTLVHATASAAAVAVAHEIARIVRGAEAEGRGAVLGLATGSTPIAVYRELVRMHREEGLSFQKVTTFNLDEYYPCGPTEVHSYRRFMQENLFDHIDIERARTHVPDGAQERSAVPAHCVEYEAMIKTAGGLDFQLLGIGRTGHIAFNEPGASGASRTRLVTLHATTLSDNRQLVPDGSLPAQAITMGVGTILEAKRVVMLALGEHKRGIVRRAIEGPMTTEVSASFLQNHAAAVAVLDEAAASDLTRANAPWLLGPLTLQGREWDDLLERQAVIWLARETAKPILKLEEADYSRQGLEELLAHGGSAYEINLRVFKHIQNTITGWPGGRPKPGEAMPPSKRVLVFSPHPDDDVISMGGTLARLTEQGHEVHVAYQVSGASAVSASFMTRQLEFVREAREVLGDGAAEVCAEGMNAEHRRLMAMAVRRAEARSAASVTGVRMDRCHFLNLPFYETSGRAIDDEDVAIMRGVLAKVQPDQVYAAGDLADPHGTHRICLELLTLAVRAEAEAKVGWVQSCDFWLYRGAWGDWRAHEIDRAIPLSPAEVLLKRRAILRHQSQKDETPFLGGDEREFWQRAEDRTREAAELYRSLGWAEYAALETLARWRPLE